MQGRLFAVYDMDRDAGIKSYEKQVKQVMRYIEKFEYLKMYTSGIAAEDNAFYGIRTVNKLSQVQMAKMLHVDIKKYRAMEKNEKEAGCGAVDAAIQQF